MSTKPTAAFSNHVQFPVSQGPSLIALRAWLSDRRRNSLPQTSSGDCEASTTLQLLHLERFGSFFHIYYSALPIPGIEYVLLTTCIPIIIWLITLTEPTDIKKLGRFTESSHLGVQWLKLCLLFLRTEFPPPLRNQIKTLVGRLLSLNVS